MGTWVAVLQKSGESADVVAISVPVAGVIDLGGGSEVTDWFSEVTVWLDKKVVLEMLNLDWCTHPKQRNLEGP